VQGSRSAPWPVLLALLLLVCLVCGVFFPIVGYDFVNLDVFTQIADYSPIRSISWENIRQIFTSRHVTSYYPVRTLSFAVDYHLWGLDAGGFKLTNGLIHLTNVVLVFWLLARMLGQSSASGASDRTWWDASAAAFGAGIFAVHPLVVEPVTWVSGREELLMALGVLGSVHFHVTARSLEARGASVTSRLACHAGTVLCCAAACLSNAVAAVIPLLITVWDLLMLARPRARRIFCATAPLWGMAMITIVIKKLGKGHHTEVIAKAFSPEWLMTIFKLYWTNLKAIFWPRDLALTYEWTRPASFLDVEVILGATGVALTLLALWMLRRQPLALFGLLWFGIALAPTSQVMPHYVARADRFLYLPLAGLAIAAGAGAGALSRILDRRGVIAAALVVSVSILSLLGLQAGRQVRTWRSGIAVWENCLRVSANNHLAHRCLADELAQMGQLDEAISHYKAALWLDFENEMALSNYARVLVTCDPERRDYDLALQLAEFACEVSHGDNPEVPRTLAMVCNGQALRFTADGQYDRAIACYRRAIETDPEYAMASFNLALLFAMCADEDLRRPDEAVRLARRACEIVGSPDASQLMILAAAYAAARSSGLAIRTMEEAVRRAEDAGNLRQADLLRGQLRLYRSESSNHGSTD
jgi:tetratricopeptide (TPR) repeat protein